MHKQFFKKTVSLLLSLSLSLYVSLSQELTDRGWRRSGKYLYKPANDIMCCPLYIIRCDAPNFVPSKSQKKTIKRMAAFLKTGKKPREGCDEDKMRIDDKSDSQDKPRPLEGVAKLPEAESKSRVKTVRPGEGADPSKPPARKAKDIRKEKKLLKIQQMDQSEATPITTPKVQPTRKLLEEYLEEIQPSEDSAHKLTIKLVRSHPESKEFTESYFESYEVYKKYQMSVHKDPPDKCTVKGFKRFLVDSPLCEEPGSKGWDCDYGSYHLQYRIDGKLIMVGVIDILPEIVSSKYVYYDPDFDFLRLGVISALNEMGLVRKLHTHNPTLRFYCMGYYVHDCQKMKYKGEYFPSFLLCPVTNHYVPFEICQKKLDVSKYARFDDEGSPEEPTNEEGTMVMYQRQLLPYGMVRIIITDRERREFESKVKEYTQLAGASVAKTCYLFLA